MDQTWYEGYKQIKEKFDYSYKGYNLKYLIPGYLGIDLAGDVHVRDLFKAFYTAGKSIDLTQALIVKQPTLITYLIERSDYKQLANVTKEHYPTAEIVGLGGLPMKSTSLFSFTFFKHFWLAISLVFSRSIGKGIKFKLYFLAHIIKLLNQISLVEKVKTTTIKKYICFNSAYREESLLTLYFKKRNIETITIQHGIFCDFKLTIPFDQINSENWIADKMLCWGQSTVDYLTKKGFDESRFIMMGNLKYKNLKIDHIHQTFTKCLVLLGRELYVDTNNKLLDTLQEYNAKHGNSILFYIKKHPFLHDETHKEHAAVDKNIVFIGKEHSVQEVLKSDMVDFSISVNTTAYYESLALGKPCLRWTEAENEDFEGIDDKFDNLLELESQLEKLKSTNQDALKKDIERVIKYIFNPNL